MRPLPALLVFAALLQGGSPGAAEPLGALVERTISVYGGASLPAEGTMFREKGENWSNRRGAAGTILRELRWPDYLRVEIDYADGTRERRLLVGQDGWMDSQPAPPAMVAAMRLQAARLALPMLLQWERERITDIGEAAREDGKPVHRLRIDLGDGLTLFVEIDIATARILRSAGVMTIGGAEMAFGAAYGDFRDFGPISRAGREDQTAMGQETGWTRIDGIELDLPLRRDALQP